MDYSKLSDEELKDLYNKKQPDYSKMSDEELTSLYNKKEPSRSEERTFIQKASDYFPMAGAIAGGLAGGGVMSIPMSAGGAAIGTLAQQLLDKKPGIQPMEIGKEALYTGVGQTFGMGAGKVIGEGIKRMAPSVGHVFAKIPKEHYSRALEKPSILGLSRQKTGEQVGIEARKLSGMPEIPLSEAKKIIATAMGRYDKTRINPAMLKSKSTLKDVHKLLAQSAKGKGTVNLEDLHGIKRMLQEKANYKLKYKGEPSKLIKDMASGFNKKLGSTSPGYKAANETFQDALMAESFKRIAPFSPLNIGMGAVGGMSSNPLLIGGSLGVAGLRQPLVHNALLRAYGSEIPFTKMPFRRLPFGAATGSAFASSSN